YRCGSESANSIDSGTTDSSIGSGEVCSTPAHGVVAGAYRLYTFIVVKIAVSIPDPLFQVSERLTKRLGYRVGDFRIVAGFHSSTFQNFCSRPRSTKQCSRRECPNHGECSRRPTQTRRLHSASCAPSHAV